MELAEASLYDGELKQFCTRTFITLSFESSSTLPLQNILHLPSRYELGSSVCKRSSLPTWYEALCHHSQVFLLTLNFYLGVTKLIVFECLQRS